VREFLFTRTLRTSELGGAFAGCASWFQLAFEDVGFEST